MNVYEIDIWCCVSHNEKFSHNGKRMELIHALNEERAKKRITLTKEREWEVGGTRIKVKAEAIYSIRKTGTVTKQLYYVYSDGRNPRPVR